MTEPAPDHVPVPIVLHSDRRRWWLAFAGAATVLGAGLFGMSLRVWGLTVVVTAVGAVALAIVLLDLPRRASFDHDGVTRICVLRRQHLPWHEIAALERARRWSGKGDKTIGLAPPGMEVDFMNSRSRPAQDAGDHAHVGEHAGLAARRARRRITLLVDRRESRQQFEAIRDLVADHDTIVRASPPPPEDG